MQITENVQVAWSHKLTEKKTECILTVNDVEINAHSRCMHGDQYSYAIGRKMSLANAMKVSKLDKEVRTIVWKTIMSKGIKIYNIKKK